jgi:alpha-amylase/alpha-mannosidase (GH57 family)
MERYVCVHGHFYQPPRENPWLETIELQDSAYPHHDWNLRITAECYAANSASRVLDETGRIARIVNNYGQMSFNFGPTLLSWMEQHATETYRAVLQADLDSQQRFSGHGSALAQVYNHMILPLANRRDRWTQVRWGVRDFVSRFGREPEGLWLAETAVDTESLEILAEQGLRFTVLAPHQAARVRALGDRRWKDVSGGRIDPTRAYRARLPSGRDLAIFFYDGPVSRAVAFEGLLSDGAHFARRLTGAFSDQRDWPQLVHIATDGESYGHHHRHGDMALAFTLSHIEEQGLARLTNYGEFLERHPPTHEVEIVEKSSWSCAHGIDRWWSDCGCRTGGQPGWNQAWRTPLRNALDWLRDSLQASWEQQAGDLLSDPWEARDDYIGLVLDRSSEAQERFWEQQAARPLQPEETVRALKLLELQRHAMLMYTSCGWFFDELSGIETVQVVQYAGRAIQLARETLGFDPESGFLERLAQARSNLPEIGDGAAIYERFVRPAMIDLNKVGAHYAISSVFEDYTEATRIFAYAVEREHVHRRQAGRSTLLVGRALFTSRVTGEAARLAFGVVHFGDHNLQAGVRPYRGEEAYSALIREADEAFDRGDLPLTLRLLDRHFDGVSLSLHSLFRDEQRKIVDIILESTLEDAETHLGQIYDNHAPLMHFLGDLGVPLPRALQLAAEFVVNQSLRQALGEPRPDLERIARLLESARRENVTLDGGGLGWAASRTLERRLASLRSAPGDEALLAETLALARLVRSLPFDVDPWRSQNLYHELARRSPRGGEAPASARWRELLTELGDVLTVRAPQPGD